MVTIRNENHHGATVATGPFKAYSRLPMNQTNAPTSSSAVWSARWRENTSRFTTVKTAAAATASHLATSTAPASIDRAASAEASGAANAQAAFVATARSMPITVPMKPTIIRKAWASSGYPDQSRVCGHARGTPARNKPPKMPANSDAAIPSSITPRTVRLVAFTVICMGGRNAPVLLIASP